MTVPEALSQWQEYQFANANPAALLHATEVATYRMHERWDTDPEREPNPVVDLGRWYQDAVDAYGKYLEDTASMEGVV